MNIEWLGMRQAEWTFPDVELSQRKVLLTMNEEKKTIMVYPLDISALIS